MSSFLAASCMVAGRGPVSDWSEVPVKGCEPTALDSRAAPASRRACPYFWFGVVYELAVDDVE